MKNASSLHWSITTCLGAGHLPYAAGTWMSAITTVAAFALLPFVSQWTALATGLLLFLIGVWSSHHYAWNAETGFTDPREAVVDEAAAQWIAVFIVLPSSWLEACLIFLLFRLFDITKPWPISWIDKNVDGGVGVMLDDLVAGVFAAVLFLALKCATAI